MNTTKGDPITIILNTPASSWVSIVFERDHPLWKRVQERKYGIEDLKKGVLA